MYSMTSFDLSLETLQMAVGDNIHLLAGIAVFGLVTLASVAIYRLWFHPLASIPGPKLAAVSEDWLYRASKGKFVEPYLESLHRKYRSKVIRIAPNEVHIIEPELYKVIYSQGTPYKKPWSFYQSFHMPHSLTTEIDPQAHRGRRRTLNQYFSKRAVENLSPLVLDKITRLENQLRRMDKTFDVHKAIHCMTVDAISDYAFGSDSNLIEASDTFEAEFLDILNLTLSNFVDLLFHPTLSRLKFLLPKPLLLKVDKGMGKLVQLDEWAKECLDRHKAKLKEKQLGDEHLVFFDSLEDIGDEGKRSLATEFLVAGSDTSALTVTYGIYHILSNPKIRDRLTRELEEALPSIDTAPTLLQLEKIPYLTGCVNESLRLACPVPGRLPRVVPDGKPLVVDDTIIPPGSIVGMSIYNLHFDEKLWGSDVLDFNPERWLNQNEERLDQWLAPFSKGSRACIGQKESINSLV
nr:Benzoate 4-monooxygenase 1 [Colletotrichum truncatum]KAF6782594.1 Benzoate 4-monooxygenase 1 [Colletotrichum truncatum]